MTIKMFSVSIVLIGCVFFYLYVLCRYQPRRHGSRLVSTGGVGKLRSDTINLLWDLADSRSKTVAPIQLGSAVLDMCAPLSDHPIADPEREKNVTDSLEITNYAFLLIFCMDNVAAALSKYLHCRPSEILLKAVRFLNHLKPLEQKPATKDIKKYMRLGPFVFPFPNGTIINQALDIASLLAQPVIHITMEQRTVFAEQMTLSRSLNLVQHCRIK